MPFDLKDVVAVISALAALLEAPADPPGQERGEA
jgi:hypothetical protein